MTDDGINWKSAFSDDSLDELAETASDAVDEATQVDDTPEEAEAEAPTVEPHAVPPIAEMTAPPVIEQSAASAQSAEPTASAPAQRPAAAAAPRRQLAPTQKMPLAAPPPADEKKTGGIPYTKIIGALAVVIPVAIAGFMFFNGADDAATESVTATTAAVAVGTTLPIAAVPPASTVPEASTVPDESGATTLPPTTEPPPTTLPAAPQFVYPALINEVAADGALGSGCNPGSDTIPDGVWFVFLTSWSSQGATVDFSCALTGANADFQAQRRGDVVSKPIYVTNDNPKPRTADYATHAQLTLTPTVATQAGLDETYPAVDFDPVLGALESALGPPTPLWIYVNDGLITEMVVQDADSIQTGSPRPS